MARRSVLFSPGDQPELLRKAPSSGADMIVFDLEDAVAPPAKDEAREAVRTVLGEIDPECEVCVRVNAGDMAAVDIEALADGAAPDSIMLPKTSAAADVETLSAHLTDHGLSVPVLALVESAAGVLQAEEIATAPATDALLFGAEDLAADLGATRTSEGREVLYARQRVVTAASAAGVDAIDTLWTDFEDTTGLEADTQRGIEMGYEGKMAIHPGQVTVINDAFTPGDDAVEWAEKVLAARDEAEAAGKGVFAVEGEMIDAPLIAQAESIVERARAAGKR